MRLLLPHLKKIFMRLFQMFDFIKRSIKTLIAKKRIRQEGVFLSNTVHILGSDKINLGKHTILSDDVWLNSNYRKSDLLLSTIEIGKKSYIGKRNFFSSGKGIKIGDYFMSGCDCSFLSSNHNIDNPCIPYISAGCTFVDQILIGDNVWVGACVTVLGNVSIGYGSIIGANSLVLDDIPPFSIAVGSPARVIKRYSFVSKSWLPIQLYDVTEKIPDAEEYAQMLDKYSDIEMPMYAASYRVGSI